MSSRFAGWLTALLSAPALFVATSADALTRDDEAFGFEQTPPRLSYADGAVSFFRKDAGDWTPAQVNTPLAAGDLLFASEGSNFELQVGSRAFVRGGEQAELGLTSLEPDYLQLRVTSGTVALDLRSLTPGQTLEVDTPNAAFKIEHAGYYRVVVAEDVTSFTSRRGGQASATVATGETVGIAANEELRVRGTLTPELESFAAAELDPWDRWNYARSETRNEAVSARYVPSDVYGVEDLDRYGDWRTVPTYGSVWVPRGVASGWVPYSTGRWLNDPYYGWSWVDAAPWGWAPYHYGRWVYTSGFWGWCPGPRVARAYYAPALVGFYGSPAISYGAPSLGWVALGWGEPLLPWWGPTWFRARPYWVGWGGPHHHRWSWHGHDDHGGHHGKGGHHGGKGGHDGKDGHGGHGGWKGDHDRDWNDHDGHGGKGGHDGKDGWKDGHDRGGDGRDGGHDRDGRTRDGELHAYENARVKGAIVSVDRDQFGRSGRSRFRRAQSDELQPVALGGSALPEREIRRTDTREAQRPTRGADRADRPVVTARRESVGRNDARRESASRDAARRGRQATEPSSSSRQDSLRRNPPGFRGGERVATVPREPSVDAGPPRRDDARERRRPELPQQISRRDREVGPRADRPSAPRVERSREGRVDQSRQARVERAPAPRVERSREPRVQRAAEPRIERSAPPRSARADRPQVSSRGGDGGRRGGSDVRAHSGGRESGGGGNGGRGSGRGDGGGRSGRSDSGSRGDGGGRSSRR